MKTSDRADRFLELVQEIELELFNFCCYLARNRPDGEDLYQEALLKGLKAFGRLRDRSKFKSWIFQIAGNTFRNQLKRSRKFGMYSLEEIETDENGARLAVFADERANPEEDAIDSRLRQKLLDAVGQLPVRNREALIMFSFHHMSIDEICRATGSPPGTVKSRIHYARNKLRKILRGEEYRDLVIHFKREVS
jgi:RNA polymerase sigma-70 factor (ECF subfamily)